MDEILNHWSRSTSSNSPPQIRQMELPYGQFEFKLICMASPLQEEEEDMVTLVMNMKEKEEERATVEEDVEDKEDAKKNGVNYDGLMEYTI